MTTIAWDGRILAADGRSTSGGVIVQSNSRKIHVLTSRERDITLKLNESFSVVAIAVSGDATARFTLLDMLMKQKISASMTMPNDRAEFSSLIFCDQKDVINLYKRDRVPSIEMFSVNDIFAIGSGRDFALSAMKMGYGAVDAVEHAAELDVYTGGEIQIIEPFRE